MTMERTIDYTTPMTFEPTSDRRSVFHATTGVFPASVLNAPKFEAKDIAGLIAATIITLGPLAAYSLGWGA